MDGCPSYTKEGVFFPFPVVCRVSSIPSGVTCVFVSPWLTGFHLKWCEMCPAIHMPLHPAAQNSGGLISHYFHRSFPKPIGVFPIGFLERFGLIRMKCNVALDKWACLPNKSGRSIFSWPVFFPFLPFKPNQTDP